MVWTTAAIADPADTLERGKAAFAQCAACHSLEAGQNGVGPTLHALFGRQSASEDFVYSPAMRRANVTWTPEILDGYLTDPQRGRFKGNKMPFSGVLDSDTRAALISYLVDATK